MRRLLFGLMLLALTPSASAQQGTGEFRQGDAFRGPVKSVRIEIATFIRQDGAFVEGPRRFLSVSTYAPDGKRKETQHHAPDGTPDSKLVSVYDDDGNEVEMEMFDGRGKLTLKKVSRPAAGETLTYDGDESLRERRLIVKRPDGTLAETLIYDGSGALKERSVNERDEKTSVWRTYRADGSLKERSDHALNGCGGPHHTETKSFAPDGAVVGRRISESDAGVNELHATNVTGESGSPHRTRETREYDSRRNLTRNVMYRQNAKTGEEEPIFVSFYTIEYYR